MRALPLLLLLAVPGLAAAHELWVERAAGGFTVRQGHRGGATLPVDRAALQAARCVDGAGRAADLLGSAAAEAGALRLAGPCAVVAVAYDGGSWSVTPEGQVHLPRDRVKDAVRSWSSRYLAKWVDARSPRAAGALGEPLELVPAADLARARPGDTVAVRVLAGGAPVAGAVVEEGHRALGRTDARGELRLRLGAGVVSVSAWVRRPPPSPQADAELVEASLTFEVAP